ncbi:MAG: hypothetical protein KC776_07405, partial [Myxococcales bacterium]|nr:hypothetical protein [Myxococcales bacterium]
MEETQKEAKSLSGASLLLRLFWMMGGQLALLGSLAIIVRDDPAFHSAVSIGFWVVLGLMILARYLDVTKYGGAKADGETRATLADVKKFAMGGVGLGGAFWLV